MSKIDKLLIALIIFFVVILIGEGGYYFLYLRQPNTSALPFSKFLPQPKSSQPIPSPSQSKTTPKMGATPSTQPRIKSRLLDANYAIDLTMLESLAHVRKGLITDAKLTNIYRGQILEIDPKDGIDPVNHRSYGLRIKLGVDTNTNVFWFSKNELAKLTIVTIGSDGKQVPIALDQLKIGDWIHVNLTNDLLKDVQSNLLSGKIIKLK